MKSSPLKQHMKPYLKVVNNTIGTKRDLKEQLDKIYINTLVPEFSYSDCNGETVSPKKCVLL